MGKQGFLIGFCGIFLLLWLLQLSVSLHFLPMGFDITDEGYYHLYMKHSDQFSWIPYVSPMRVLFGFIEGEVMLSRGFRIFCSNLSALSLGMAVAAVMKRSSQLRWPMTVLIVLSALCGAMCNYTPRSFSYNDANWLFISCASSAFIIAVFGQVNGGAKKLLLIVSGVFIGMGMFIKPSSIALLTTVMILFVSVQSRSGRLKSSLVEIAMMSLGALVSGAALFHAAFMNLDGFYGALEGAQMISQYMNYLPADLLTIYVQEDFPAFASAIFLALLLSILLYFVRASLGMIVVFGMLIVLVLVSENLTAPDYRHYMIVLLAGIGVFLLRTVLTTEHIGLHWPLIVGLLFMAPIHAVGSNMGLIYHFYTAMPALLIALTILVLRSGRGLTGWAPPLALALTISAVASSKFGFKDPTGIGRPLSLASTPVVIANDSLFLFPDEAVFFNQLQFLLLKEGVVKGDTVLGMSVIPGIVYAMGLHPLKFPFFFPSLHSQKALEANRYLIDQIKLSDFKRPPAVLMLLPTDSLNIPLLDSSVLQFSEKYKLAGKIRFPYVNGATHSSFGSDGWLYLFTIKNQKVWENR